MSEQLNFNEELALSAMSPRELDVQNYAFYIEHKFPTNFQDHDRESVDYKRGTLVTLMDPVTGLITASSITPTMFRSNLQLALEQQTRFAGHCSLINYQTRIFNHRLLYTVSNLLTSDQLYMDARNFADSHVILSDNTVITTTPEADDVESALLGIVNKLVNHICYNDFTLMSLPEISHTEKYLEMYQAVNVESVEMGNIVSVNLKYNDREIFAQFSSGNQNTSDRETFQQYISSDKKKKNVTEEDVKNTAVELFVLGTLLPNNMKYTIPYTLIDTDGIRTAGETTLEFSDLVIELEEARQY